MQTLLLLLLHAIVVAAEDSRARVQRSAAAGRQMCCPRSVNASELHAENKAVAYLCRHGAMPLL